MTLVYKNMIKSIGSAVESIEGEEMFILFGDNAPDMLKDFCYCVDIEPVSKTIEVGQILTVDNQEFKITAVGNIAEKNLASLGHVTVVFDGSSEASLPGSIYVEKKSVPTLKVGTEISILA